MWECRKKVIMMWKLREAMENIIVLAVIGLIVGILLLMERCSPGSREYGDYEERPWGRGL